MACDPLSSDGGGCELSDVAMAPATAIPRDVWTVAQSGVAPRDVVVGSLFDRKRRPPQCDSREAFNLAGRDPSAAPTDALRDIHGVESRAIHARVAVAAPSGTRSTFTQPPSPPAAAAEAVLGLRRSATGEARDLASKMFHRTLTTTSNPAARPLLDPDSILLDSDMARATCPSSVDPFRHDVPARIPQLQDWSVAAGRSFLPRLDRIHISRPAPSPGVAFPGHDRPRPAQQHELGLSASAPHGSLPLRLQCSWMWEQPLQLSQPSQRSQPRQLVDLNQSTDEPPLAVLTQEKGAQHAASSLPSSHSPTALASQRAFALQDWGQAVHSPLKKPRGSPEAIGRQAVALAISEREEEIFQRRREQRLRILGGLRHALDEPAAACAAAAAGLDGQSPLFVLRQGPFSCRISSRACNAEKAGSQGGVTEMRESGDATGGGAVEGGDTTAARFAPGVWGEAGANDGGGGLGRRSDEVCNGAGALAEPRTLGATLAVELRSTMRVEVTSPHAAALASLDARKALPFLAAPFAPLPAGWKQQRRVRARSAFESRDLMSGGGEGFSGSPGRAELLAEGALRSPALAREAAECGKRAQKRRNSSEWELYAGGEEARGEWGRGETGWPAGTGRGGRSSRGGDSSVETRRDGTGQGEGGGEAEQGGQHEVESRGGAQKEMEKEGVREEEWEWERAKVRREEGQGTFDMLTWEQGQGQGQGQQAEMRWQTIGPPWLTPGQAEQQQLEQQKEQGAEQQQWWQQGGVGKQRGMEGLVEEGVRAPIVPYLRSASQSHACSPLILTPFSAPHTRDRLLGGAGGRLGAAAGPAAAAAPAAAAHRRAASSVPILGGTLAVSRVGQVDSESGGVLSSSGVAGGAAEFPLWVRNSEVETYLHSAAQPVLLAESMGES